MRICIGITPTPDFVAVPLAKLLSESYAASLCGKIDPQHAATPGPEGDFTLPGDTIVLSAADSDGNMVSWVNSNFGVSVPESRCRALDHAA